MRIKHMLLFETGWQVREWEEMLEGRAVPESFDTSSSFSREIRYQGLSVKPPHSTL